MFPFHVNRELQNPRIYSRGGNSCGFRDTDKYLQQENIFFHKQIFLEVLCLCLWDNCFGVLFSLFSTVQPTSLIVNKVWKYSSLSLAISLRYLYDKTFDHHREKNWLSQIANHQWISIWVLKTAFNSHIGQQYSKEVPWSQETITSHVINTFSSHWVFRFIQLVWEVWVEKEVPHRPQAEEKSENWAKWGDSSNTREGAGDWLCDD